MRDPLRPGERLLQSQRRDRGPDPSLVADDCYEIWIEGINEGHHGLTHHGRNPEKIEQLKIVEKVTMAAFRELLVSLRDTQEGTASLLDSTQVLIGSNLGDASGHGTTNLPILLAGGGYRHGQHIAGDTGNNTPLAKLYVNMLQKFGVPTDKFGSGAGTVTELS